MSPLLALGIIKVMKSPTCTPNFSATPWPKITCC
ncbi:Uncharacterised protein [Vibrio cholerae]|nr:Uncharacterised protein [Vibrio cholerae]CSI75565.1 Uncharacterised protein [Vibrio cholerae]